MPLNDLPVPTNGDRQDLDLNTAPVLKEPRDPTSRLMTRREADDYVAQQTLNSPAEPLAPPPAAPPPAAPAAAPASPAAPAAPAAANPAVPTVPTVPAGPEPALVSPRPMPASPPVQPGDSERVQTRINRLYAQKKTAEETADNYFNRIQELERQVQTLRSVPPAAENRPVLGPGGMPTSEPAGDSISRTEVQGMFAQMAQVIQQRDQLAASQSASRSEVERDFAQYFQSPQFRSTYDTVLREDSSLKSDPNGPYKAALMASGMLADVPASEPAAAADAAKRQALTGIGPSVPEGAPAQSNDQETRYKQALAYARSTGRDQDYVRALLIRDGRA